ncbi:fumarylacetoacetate hydrolase family protein [Aeromicrobium fastidiosum]|uniref:Fumarylacetoacetate hydrolase family protein n=1 Tax=Aeromicrobium fastidiosum TaxID=52699 RepID=A0A641API3_9ACTN|nr:fumarylacetoacetate hydrolase family protein [Aeromicrobium fastidiosum]KAA1378155.1 fumarylacetoacetate hydrolase family protein [Aeromicrobium fastidiosum]MBP2389042.1 2-keto-4-pentenoate hydratase/2-oxohepta-3-ene-1,7-dioic acid hydratase in catechol pathway [Aeromicrobium fastidiosum]
MRLAAVRSESGPRIGVVSDDLERIVVLDPALGTVDDVVRGGRPALEEVRAAAAAAGSSVAIGEVELDAPLRRFNRDVLCTGWNYLDHFYESQGKREGQDPVAMPDHPAFFTKGPDTVVGPMDDIAFDEDLSSKWDYEAELALVIGTEGRSIPEADALDHVFGYFVANDVSQRDLQRAHGGQWLKGKSIDQTMPIGPWITTADEIGDVADLVIECRVNDVLVQHATVGQMAFTIARVIAELSRGMTLRPGDVVLTGTPSGIGNAREPQVFLQDGDRVVTGISTLGTLVNTVRRTALV